MGWAISRETPCHLVLSIALDPLWKEMESRWKEMESIRAK
jgi:hypothetical protein